MISSTYTKRRRKTLLQRMLKAHPIKYIKRNKEMIFTLIIFAIYFINLCSKVIMNLIG